MAGKTIGMLERRKMLQDQFHGKSDRATARAAGVCRKALNGYLDRLAVSKMEFGELLKSDDAQVWKLGKHGAGIVAAGEVVDSRVQALFAYLETAIPDLGYKGVKTSRARKTVWVREWKWKSHRMPRPKHRR